MARMNWDKVRRENLAFRHGAEDIRDEMAELRKKEPVKRTQSKPGISGNTLVLYPTCKARVKYANVDRHLRQVHATGNLPRDVKVSRADDDHGDDSRQTGRQIGRG